MVGFLVTASTGVMNSLLRKLSTLLTDEYRLLKGARREIRALRDELSSMNSLLQRLADMAELDVQRKDWRDKARELAYDIEDCIDVFTHRALPPPGPGGGGFVRKMAALRARRRVAVQVRRLRCRVVEESDRRRRYELEPAASGGGGGGRVEIDPRLPALYAEAKSLVGIGRPREKIVQWLTGVRDAWEGCHCPPAAGDQLGVVSIVGFGGVGKTTLANQVYRKIRHEFQCTAFVSVSQNPDVLKILGDILDQVGSRRTTGGILDDQHKLIDKIRERLTNKRGYNRFSSKALQGSTSRPCVDDDPLQEQAQPCLVAGRVSTIHK
ncbi:putative disease resistance protein At1g50180 isoform X2 [Brachypodium distachyon]|uniref:putative disease resistance protein At1g50180 isoform X2 n=1 Tax=Brachypodium distachyon TaxID=15368 RepID=UPI000D0D2609|nr:putative disease resistance protein At1g50180 isoform X2 [Brachypodium distachyon]|eukprot:XP_024319269.1 putative disease resistance protein At1g50180 isoform X2 [Brachypodium distachyon]